MDRPNVHTYLREMNDLVLAHYPDICTVGEMPCGVTTYQASKYVAKERQELSMVFQFDHVDLDATNGDKWIIRKWALPELKNVIEIWQQHMLGNRGWNSLYFENHDQPRALSRLTVHDGSEPMRSAAAKMIATLLLSLRGTVYVYQGQELGMTHPEDWSIEDYDDVETQMYYARKLAERKTDENPNPDMSDVMRSIFYKGRDNARTPMQVSAPTPFDGNDTDESMTVGRHPQRRLHHRQTLAQSQQQLSPPQRRPRAIDPSERMALLQIPHPPAQATPPALLRRVHLSRRAEPRCIRLSPNTRAVPVYGDFEF